MGGVLVWRYDVWEIFLGISSEWNGGETGFCWGLEVLFGECAVGLIFRVLSKGVGSSVLGN